MPNLIIKFIVVGDSGVGKSNLMLRYTDNAFTPSHITTIGADFKIRTTHYEDKKVKIQIWDTAGQERFRTITNAYYRGTHGVMIVFDLTDRKSFENVKMWLDDAKREGDENMKFILVGNKSDLESHRVVSEEECRQLANDLKLPYVETSALNGNNVNDAFNELVTQVCHQLLPKNALKGLEVDDTSAGTSRFSCSC